jgi:predicted porin
MAVFYAASQRLAVGVAAAFMLMMGPGSSFADEKSEKALLEQLQIMQQRMDALTHEVQALKQQVNSNTAATVQTAPQPGVPTPSSGLPASASASAVRGAGPVPGPVNGMPAPNAKASGDATREPLFERFLKGFYGTLDVSFDDVTKGINGLTAYSYGLNDPTNPNSGYVQGDKKGVQQVGRLGYLPALSTNKSQIGYRNTHRIGETDTDFILQVETSLAVTSSPGLRTQYTQQSNVVTGAIGLGDTFVGLQGSPWGKFKFGTTYSPYKKSTDAMNPFSGMLGDYAVIMGNTGGDNRVEFGTRLDHSLWYESPKLFHNLFSFDLLWSPGQNRTFDNVVQSAGSPDCSGGNEPGSGNLPLNCDDGGFSDAYSADLKFEWGGLYAIAAWEEHRAVNRNSDGIGSNHPIYNYLLSINSPLLDFNTFNAYSAEFPGYATVATPGYRTDIGDEMAYKLGAKYTWPMGLSISGIWESMKRQIPQALEFQNERTRIGWWFAASQDLFGPKDNVSIGYGHGPLRPGSGRQGSDHRLSRRYQHGIRGLQWGGADYLGRLPGTGVLDRAQLRVLGALGLEDDLFGLVDEVALDELHADLPEDGHGVGIFDALGDGLDLLLRRELDQRADPLLQLRVAGQALDDGAVDLDEVERHRFQHAVRIAARAEAVDGEPEAAFAQRIRQGLDLREVLRGCPIVHLEAQALWIGAARAHVVVEPVNESGVPRRFLGEAHKQAARLALRGEGEGGTDDPAVDVLEQVVALGGGHELRREDLLALRVHHADQHVEHFGVIAMQAGYRLLYQPEAVLHQGGLDVFDPDLVVRLHARVGVGLVGGHHLIAAAVTPAHAGVQGIRDGRIQLNFAGRHHRKSNSARE